MSAYPTRPIRCSGHNPALHRRGVPSDMFRLSLSVLNADPFSLADVSLANERHPS